ncbi:VOC family protein [Desulfonatronum parangueonense]
MAACSIDHIAVTAPSLEIGAEFIQESLGVTLEPGGKHPRMGTHNLLLRLDATLYLEVIAPDPKAPQPGRPRWFGLDKLQSDSSPELSAWIARTEDIRSVVASSTEDLGAIETMHRGGLQWLITIPATGRAPIDGVAPALIEWPQGVHPTENLRDQGLSLIELQLVHPDPNRITQLLASLNIRGPLKVCTPSLGEAPHLRAVLGTPQGTRTLSPFPWEK